MKSKEQPFDPAKRSPRQEQTERAYRNIVRMQLLNILTTMNPQDSIHFGSMSYEELVVYTRDWLDTEVKVVTGQPGEEQESGGLALDD